jgi:hypothetical protein
MVDFEAAIWTGLRQSFPEGNIQGCCFHWTQAVWRKVQELGLATSYMEDEGSNKYIRRLMALPFLPHEHIRPMFLSLEKEAEDEKLKALCNYIAITWVDSDTWAPHCWTVFLNLVRTNNDC